MTSQQLIEQLMQENGKLRNVIDEMAAAASEGKIAAPFIPEPTSPQIAADPCKPFESADFFAGAIDVIDWLTKVATDTKGSQVWRSLFEATRTNLVKDAQSKGFAVK